MWLFSMNHRAPCLECPYIIKIPTVLVLGFVSGPRDLKVNLIYNSLTSLPPCRAQYLADAFLLHVACARKTADALPVPVAPITHSLVVLTPELESLTS